MNELKVFSNEEFGDVRVVEITGNVWFVGKDVSVALGYSNVNESITYNVDLDDRLMLDKTQSTESIELDYKELGQRGGWLINESGLYSLILGSKLPYAKKFKRWVTSDVLPSIRKHGAYMTEQTLEKALTSPDFLIQLATQLKSEQEARRLAEEKFEEAKPMIEFADSVIATDKAIDMKAMAKLCNSEGIKIGRNRLFEFLRDQKVLMSDNTPYQRYMEWFEVTETVKFGKLCIVTLIKPKGQIGIVNLVKKKY